eukprot:2176672-Rhodomonas_salina.2
MAYAAPRARSLVWGMNMACAGPRWCSRPCVRTGDSGNADGAGAYVRSEDSVCTARAHRAGAHLLRRERRRVEAEVLDVALEDPGTGHAVEERDVVCRVSLIAVHLRKDRDVARHRLLVDELAVQEHAHAVAVCVELDGEVSHPCGLGRREEDSADVVGEAGVEVAGHVVAVAVDAEVVEEDRPRHVRAFLVLAQNVAWFRPTMRQTDRQADRQTSRQRQTETDSQAARETETERQRQRDRQTDTCILDPSRP